MGLNTKEHMVVDAQGMPIRIIIIQGSKNDWTQASELIQAICAYHLIVGKAHNTNTILESATNSIINHVTLSKKK